MTLVRLDCLVETEPAIPKPNVQVEVSKAGLRILFLKVLFQYMSLF